MNPQINELLYYRNGRLYLPFRAILEHYQFTVSFNRTTGEIKAQHEDLEILVNTNSKTVKVNNEKRVLDETPFIMNGTTYLPVRFLAETLSESFDWGVGHTLVLR